MTRSRKDENWTKNPYACVLGVDLWLTQPRAHEESVWPVSGTPMDVEWLMAGLLTNGRFDATFWEWFGSVQDGFISSELDIRPFGLVGRTNSERFNNRPTRP